MATSTVTGAEQHPSPLQSESNPADAQLNTDLDKFPTFVDDHHDAPLSSSSHSNAAYRSIQDDHWIPRKAERVAWQNGAFRKHRPRKSISEAISTIRTRNASVSANAHELANALGAPVSYRLIILCVIWYMTSALTNTSSKSILNALPQPITLTIVQFAFVATWCLTLTYLSTVFPALKKHIPALKNGIRYPTREVILTALPLAIFQLAGHILSSMATSQIPVSLVHTIKGLSPLFTVFAYRVFFRIRYAKATYLSLIPLTLGVMLACSTGFSTDFFGILCAFLAALVFVAQNIFSKKLFNEAARAELDMQSGSRRKLDKLNLLCYCSGLAFLLTLPIWAISEGYTLISQIMRDGSIALSVAKGSLDHGELLLEFVFNGVTHFAQNILAFVLLSMISPVSYSVASLVKRVFVIIVAIVWFGSSTTSVQALGIALTFLGLYLYDRNSHDDLADQRANADHFRGNESLLPMNAGPSGKQKDSNGYAFPTSKALEPENQTLRQKKEDDPPEHMRTRAASNLPRTWLPPGTKQESTWQPTDS
ncbi:hypothetical protein ASPZODRAFT_70299 [Penicilliopsis zonata CBS 506.65]|uniref:Sugar phosphate transporter domain-containing protein n=1 Tax=Penicilliopsis zonata CBS 506.65 TaxID=1073090 RepID=A0A1L9SCN0_9EURO|nr:hypothetical protein ASPZODRAFT_70299 [Penicilliopsis zonata CBS 506.65]OJJ44847.1 hypothetical protein ASPZODRAFT_70299 [Penicilliopsis zonata CBS 506.65]